MSRRRARGSAREGHGSAVFSEGVGVGDSRGQLVI